MINVLKYIQIIIFAFMIIPCVLIILREPFVRYKKYRKQRLTVCTLITLLSSLIYIVCSIIISDNVDIYKFTKYGTFIQSWVVIKCVLTVYVEIIMSLIVFIGLFFTIILLFEICLNKRYFKIVKCVINNHMTIMEKFKYPFMYYEMFVNIKLTKDNHYILSKRASKELDKYLSRGN